MRKWVAGLACLALAGFGYNAGPNDVFQNADPAPLNGLFNCGSGDVAYSITFYERYPATLGHTLNAVTWEIDGRKPKSSDPYSRARFLRLLDNSYLLEFASFRSIMSNTSPDPSRKLLLVRVATDGSSFEQIDLGTKDHTELAAANGVSSTQEFLQLQAELFKPKSIAGEQKAIVRYYKALSALSLPAFVVCVKAGK